MMSMEVNKIVYINSKKAACWCSYYRDWNRIPVFITEDIKNSKSALYEDGTSFFIISSDLFELHSAEFIYNRLWHEVSHLYHKDVWLPWNIDFEYRADLVASAATSKDLTLKRLSALKRLSVDGAAEKILEKRFEHLLFTPNPYKKAAVFNMFRALKPVKVL
jgi:Zn-dependent protease with chaperone function